MKQITGLLGSCETDTLLGSKYQASLIWSDTNKWLPGSLPEEHRIISVTVQSDSLVEDALVG